MHSATGRKTPPLFNSSSRLPVHPAPGPETSTASEEQTTVDANALATTVSGVKSLDDLFRVMTETITMAHLRTTPELVRHLVERANQLGEGQHEAVEEVALRCLPDLFVDNASTALDMAVWSRFISLTSTLPVSAAQALMQVLKAHRDQHGLPFEAADQLTQAQAALQARQKPTIETPQQSPQNPAHPSPAQPLATGSGPSGAGAAPSPNLTVSQEQLGPWSAFQSAFREYNTGLNEIADNTISTFQQQPVRLFDSDYRPALKVLVRASGWLSTEQQSAMVVCIAKAIRTVCDTGVGVANAPALRELRQQLPPLWWTQALNSLGLSVDTV